MKIVDIIDRVEELVEIVDSLSGVKGKSEIAKKNLSIVEGSVWHYNKHRDFTCTVVKVHEDCLDVLMCPKWKGKAYYEMMLTGFFELNFTEIEVFQGCN